MMWYGEDEVFLKYIVRYVELLGYKCFCSHGDNTVTHH